MSVAASTAATTVLCRLATGRGASATTSSIASELGNNTINANGDGLRLVEADGIQDKPHFGKDDKTKDFLYQYHKGYYHNDE